MTRLIGEGGMGRVYEAKDERLGRSVAVKVLLPDLFLSADRHEVTERFRREAGASSRLEHPNAVTIHDFFHSEEGFPCVVMELLHGTTVHDLVSRDGPLSNEIVARVIDQALDVLGEAHAIGLVHRDVNSRNIMIEDMGGAQRVTLLDFGMVKMVGAHEGTTIEQLTRAGVVLGTPQYMSPEQARGEFVDRRSDLYSVGIVMYEMLSGRLPFDGENPMEVLVAQVQRPVPPLPAEVPVSLREVVARALAKDPGERFQDATDFRRALAAARRAEDRGTTATVRSAPPARLVPASDDLPVLIEGGINIGRHSSNDVVVTGAGVERVSSVHARVEWRDGVLWAIDLDSTNGTYVNGRRIREVEVRDGSTLALARNGPSYRIELLDAGERQGPGPRENRVRRALGWARGIVQGRGLRHWLLIS